MDACGLTWFTCLDPNNKKRHSVGNLKAARDKARKTLHGQHTLELQCIQQGNMQLISKLTESSK